MAVNQSSVVGTTAYRGGALREDLANFISNISRDETPFLSSIGSTKAKLPRHEWQVDVLAAPTSEGQIAEGSTDFSSADAVNVTTTRLSNYTEIRDRDVHVSGSLLKSDPAGAANWFSYSMKKRGRELKRDFEARAVQYHHNTQGVDTGGVFDAGTTRKMGSFAAFTANWVRAANTTMEANPASGAATALTTVNGESFNTYSTLSAVTDGIGGRVVQYTAAPTTVQLTLTQVSRGLKEAFDNGGRINTAQVPSGLKARFSDILVAGNGGAAQRRAEAMSKKVNIAVDSVMSEFGFDITIIPNYVMEILNDTTGVDATTHQAVYMYDASMIKEAVLSPVMVEEDGTARYGKGAYMSCEKTVQYANPNSQIVIPAVTS